MTRAIVCGGREYSDASRVDRILSEAVKRLGLAVIIQGGARGADRLAAEWGRRHNLRVGTYPADWKRYGNSAGPIRNAEMLRLSKPDIVIAFPGGPGTHDMVQRAEAAGVRVIKVDWQ